MTTREQITTEKLNALIEVLENEGVLSAEWRDSLRAVRESGEGREVAEAAREGRGPPDHSGPPE